MWWRFIRKYTRSNYTIYRMNYSKGNAAAASLSDVTTTGDTTCSVKKTQYSIKSRAASPQLTAVLPQHVALPPGALFSN